MTPQSNMRPPVQQEPAESAGPFSPEDIQQIAQETGFPPERVRQDIERTHATTKEQLYPTYYSGAGIEPMQPLGGGMPVAPPPSAPEEESAEPPQAAPQEAAEGENLSPEGVAAMQMAMRHAGPTGRKQREPPPPRRAA